MAILCAPAATWGQTVQSKPAAVDDVLHRYVQALGGEAALSKIETREIQAKGHLLGKVTYYWAKPDKVLRLRDREKRAYDGSTGWVLSKKKKLTKLPKSEQTELQMHANPLRYAHLKDLYSELDPAPPEQIDGRVMDVLVAPNNIGATKFYFDQGNHLLVRIQDFGVISAYYKEITDFLDYRKTDGILYPYRIVHSSDEPGRRTEEIRVAKLDQNVDLDLRMFSKPNVAAVTLGGKR